VWFDSTGAVVAQYEVVNWQQDSNGSIKFKPVGYYDASLAPDQRFVLNTDNIIWAGGQLEVNGCNMFIIQGLFKIGNKMSKHLNWSIQIA